MKSGLKVGAMMSWSVAIFLNVTIAPPSPNRRARNPYCGQSGAVSRGAPGAGRQGAAAGAGGGAGVERGGGAHPVVHDGPDEEEPARAEARRPQQVQLPALDRELAEQVAAGADDGRGQRLGDHGPRLDLGVVPRPEPAALRLALAAAAQPPPRRAPARARAAPAAQSGAARGSLRRARPERERPGAQRRPRRQSPRGGGRPPGAEQLHRNDAQCSEAGGLRVSQRTQRTARRRSRGAVSRSSCLARARKLRSFKA